MPDLELKGKEAMATAARALASSFELVVYDNTTFIPADWATAAISPPPDPLQRIWLPLSRKEKLQLANQISKILFANDAELSSFDYMLQQFAADKDMRVDSIFIRTEGGLRVLDCEGELVEPDGEFRPNYIKPVLNEDPVLKQEVFDIIAHWVDGEEEAHSLLHHMATALAPGYSAVKYVLLLGDGRNGKSLLLSMLVDLFGAANVSNVTRQQMAEQSPVTMELNAKLLNIVFDGRMDYIKDSGLEKTLIAGEPGFIRPLYSSSLVRVQTTGMFLEGLNKEPKSRDKSSALQKRLVRYWFPHVFPRDLKFERHMRSQPMLGAFLSLLVDHYVREDQVIDKLAMSAGAIEMQVNQMWLNSPVLQYVSAQETKDPGFDWVGSDLDILIGSFMAWRMAEGFSEYSSADTAGMFRDSFDITWKTKRENGKYVRKRIITGIKGETEALLTQLREGGTTDDAEHPEAVVAD